MTARQGRYTTGAGVSVRDAMWTMYHVETQKRWTIMHGLQGEPPLKAVDPFLAHAEILRMT